jgi:site-specific recombinase XerD
MDHGKKSSPAKYPKAQGQSMIHLSQFLTSRVAAGLTVKTVEWYSWMLSGYADYCQAHGLDAHAPESVEAFMVYLRRRNAAPSSVAAYYRALRVYFGWLLKRGYSEVNPLSVIDRPRVPRQRRRHVTLAEFGRLYDGIETDGWLDYRDRAILIVMFYSGLRVGEVIGLQPGDVDTLHGLITVRHGKGGHARIVPCAPLLSDPLRTYLKLRPVWNKPALWISSDGYVGVRGALTAEGIRVMLRRRCEAIGLRYINPHQFRHGFAMTLLNAGMELSAVSAAMGHSSQSVTEQVYAAWLTDGLSREYNEALKRLETSRPT